MKNDRHFDHFLAQLSFQTIVLEKIETNSLCSIYIFFFENPAMYEIMWKKVLELDRPLMTIWRMRIAFFVPRAASIYSEYVIIIAFPL